MKKLSIIVPVYKVEKYLPGCLDSLLTQTLKDIEIICINDGSPDNCLQILRDYQERSAASDGPQIVIIDKQNEGTWKGRWDGIAKAQGEYIGFLDSDDTASPTFAESLYTTAKNADADIAVCGFDRIELETGKRLSREMAGPREGFTIANDPGRLIELNGAPWNKCFKAEHLKHMHNLSATPAILDDLAFHLLAYLNMHGKVVFVPESNIHYMVRGDSLINTVKHEAVDNVLAAFLEIKGFYKNERPELTEVLDAIAFLHLGVSLVYRLSASESNAELSQDIDAMTTFLDKKLLNLETFPLHEARLCPAQQGRLHQALDRAEALQDAPHKTVPRRIPVHNPQAARRH